LKLYLTVHRICSKLVRATPGGHGMHDPYARKHYTPRLPSGLTLEPVYWS
jgi:hypothetical protein